MVDTLAAGLPIAVLALVGFAAVFAAALEAGATADADRPLPTGAAGLRFFAVGVAWAFTTDFLSVPDAAWWRGGALDGVEPLTASLCSAETGWFVVIPRLRTSVVPACFC